MYFAGTIPNEGHVAEEPSFRIGARFCNHSRCDMYGDVNYEGFCSGCYSNILHGHRRHMQPTPTEMVPCPPAITQHRPVSYANYLQIGSANHITIEQEIPPSSVHTPSSSSHDMTWPAAHPTNQPQLAVNHIETASRSSVAQCKTLGCLNYGHSKNKGYCNSCFVKVDNVW